MAIRIINKSQQAYGAFNGGQIVENKPVGFPQDGGFVRPFSNLFYWARAEAVVDSTIGLHPHQGFEIMSFVLEGRIRHFDTKHNAWKPLNAGDVQIIRAGNGIQHAEHMEKGAVIFQIWFDPDLGKTLQKEASYDDYTQDTFPTREDQGAQRTTYIGQGAPITMDSEVRVDRLLLRAGYDMQLRSGKTYALYMISGSGAINGQTVEQDDFIIVEDEETISLTPDEQADVFLVELNSELDYRTYAARMAERSHS
ncbi:MAG: pirin family protein [Saprospiraceae bacterium]|nr:pirin family protein [Saprospiraceae bacterium]